MGPHAGAGQTLKSTGWDGTSVTGKGDSGNAASSTAVGSAFANSLGTDAKLFEPARIGSGTHVLQLSGDGDNYLLGTLTVTIVLHD